MKTSFRMVDSIFKDIVLPASNEISVSSSTATPPSTTTTPSPSSLPHFDFTSTHYNVTIRENANLKVYASSVEKMGIFIDDPALQVRYKIVAGDSQKIFRAETKHVGNFYFLLIRMRMGTKMVLNREYMPAYDLRVRATITSSRSDQIKLKTKCSISVTVLDDNDNWPFFFQPSYVVDVQENVPLDTKVVQVKAVDPDSGRNGQIYYSIEQASPEMASTLFAVHPTLGFVYTTRPLTLHTLLKQQVGRSRGGKGNNDFVSISLTILAKDRGLHSSSQVVESSRANVTIRVRPVNRHAPEINIKQHSTLSTTYSNVDDSTASSSRPLYAVVHVTDDDLGRFGEICHFGIVHGNHDDLFRVTNTTSPYDYNVELAKTIGDMSTLLHRLPFKLIVQAQDCGGLVTNDTITISMDDNHHQSSSKSPSSIVPSNAWSNYAFAFTSDNFYGEIHESSLLGTQILRLTIKTLSNQLLLGSSGASIYLKNGDRLSMGVDELTSLFKFEIIGGDEQGVFGLTKNGKFGIFDLFRCFIAIFLPQ